MTPGPGAYLEFPQRLVQNHRGRQLPAAAGADCGRGPRARASRSVSRLGRREDRLRAPPTPDTHSVPPFPLRGRAGPPGGRPGPHVPQARKPPAALPLAAAALLAPPARGVGRAPRGPRPGLLPIGRRAGGARRRGPSLAARAREGRPGSAGCRGRARGDAAGAEETQRRR